MFEQERQETNVLLHISNSTNTLFSNVSLRIHFRFILVFRQARYGKCKHENKEFNHITVALLFVSVVERQRRYKQVVVLCRIS